MNKVAHKDKARFGSGYTKIHYRLEKKTLCGKFVDPFEYIEVPEKSINSGWAKVDCKICIKKFNKIEGAK